MLTTPRMTVKTKKQRSFRRLFLKLGNVAKSKNLRIKSLVKFIMKKRH